MTQIMLGVNDAQFLALCSGYRTRRNVFLLCSHWTRSPISLDFTLYDELGRSAADEVRRNNTHWGDMSLTAPSTVESAQRISD